MKYNPYVSDLSVAVFDIETTGLDPKRDSLVLTGIYSPEERKIVQHFAEHPEQERDIVSQTIEALRNYDAVLTYNGDAFDWPFFQAAAERHGLCISALPPHSIDVYRLIRQYGPWGRQLPNLKQKSVEYALGLSEERKDELSGAEFVRIYRKYQTVRDAGKKTELLLHNRDDVLQLAKLSDALSFLPYHRIAAEQGFLVKGAAGRIRVNGIRLLRDRITASARVHPAHRAASLYREDLHMNIDGETGALTLSLRLHRVSELGFVNLAPLPVSGEALQHLQGYSDGLLVVQDGSKTLHKEVCALVRALLEQLLKEELHR